MLHKGLKAAVNGIMGIFFKKKTTRILQWLWVYTSLHKENNYSFEEGILLELVMWCMVSTASN